MNLAGQVGKLTIEVTSCMAVDGSKVSLRGFQDKTGKGGAGMGSYAAGLALLGVVGIVLVALAGGAGKNVKIPAGTNIDDTDKSWWFNAVDYIAEAGSLQVVLPTDRQKLQSLSPN